MTVLSDSFHIFVKMVLCKWLLQSYKTDHHNRFIQVMLIGRFCFQADLSLVTSVESAVIETLITMVMKMSEASFRPMLFKVCSVRLIALI